MVTNFVAAAGREALQDIRIASIGPITSATLREHGIEPTVEAQPHTIGGLVEAIRVGRPLTASEGRGSKAL